MPNVSPKDTTKRKDPPGRVGTLTRLFRPKALNRKHPLVTDRTRTFLATLTFAELVLGFVLVTFVTTMAAGLLFWLLSPPNLFEDFPEAVSSAFFTIIGMAPADLDPDDASGAFLAVLGFVGLGSLLLPALFLGAIVFRLLVRLRVFVVRERPLVTKKTVRGVEGWYLAVRLYSSTSILVVDVSFKIYLRLEDTERYLLSNEELAVANQTWPIADTHVPFTIYVPLEPCDLDPDRGLVSVQGHSLENCVNMVIHIRGAAPQLASEINESHVLEVIEGLKPANFPEVNVLYDGRGPDWQGWDRFERDDPVA